MSIEQSVAAAVAHAAAGPEAPSETGAVALRPWELRVLGRTSTSDKGRDVPHSCVCF
jgi:hypothetical protein